MEGAVKVPSMASVKMAAKERPVAQKTSVENNGFTTLLQIKKDAVKDSEPEKTNGTEGKKPIEKPETKSAGNKKEDLKGQPEESQDLPEQLEALEKAALQLAAAQMVVMVSEEPVPGETENIGEIGLTVAGEQPENMPVLQEVLLQEQPAAEQIPAGQLLQEGQAMQKQPGQKQLEQEQLVQPEKIEMEKPVERDAAIQEQPAKEVNEEKQNLQVVRTSVTTKEDLPKAEVKTDSRGQESQEDFSGLERRQMQEGEGQQITGAFRVSGQPEPLFQEAKRMETMPLRTAPDTLPQDLGKTLAARLPEAGRTLTVELEPASLGKLTIRMTYEAGRAAVSILATNPRTLEILSEKATEIASILEEKTGQETVILTQRPQEQEEYQENKQGGNAREDQGQSERRGEEHHANSDSFAQQLRLGLV